MGMAGLAGLGLAGGALGRLVYILNYQHARYIYRGHTVEIAVLAWSPTGQRIASGAENVQVWDALSGAHVQTFPALEGAQAVAWSPDGKYLASGSGYGTATVWEAATGKKLLIYVGHVPGAPPRPLASTAAALSRPLAARRIPGVIIIGLDGLAWSPDGTRLLSTGPDHTAQVWEALTGRTLLTFGTRDDAVYHAAWSPDGRQIATGAYGQVRIWDATSGALRFTSQEITGTLSSLAWSPNGRYLAASSDQVIQVWEAATDRHVLTYRGHSGRVGLPAWSPDSRHLASSEADVTVHVWEATTGQTEYIYRGHESFWQQFFLAQMQKAPALASGITQIAPLPHEGALAGNTSLLRPQDTYPPPPAVTALAWSPDGQYIASGGTDATVQVWQPG
jgi:WD40 repeat protein